MIHKKYCVVSLKTRVRVKASVSVKRFDCFILVQMMVPEKRMVKWCGAPRCDPCRKLWRKLMTDKWVRGAPRGQGKQVLAALSECEFLR